MLMVVVNRKRSGRPSEGMSTTWEASDSSSSSLDDTKPARATAVGRRSSSKSSNWGFWVDSNLDEGFQSIFSSLEKRAQLTVSNYT